jgi:TonB family protein
MVLWSIGGHIAMVLVVLLWPARAADDTQQLVMTISLGGAPGPRSGGMSQLGARAVQAPSPDEAVVRPPIRPPAAAPPPMALPAPTARPPRPRPQQAPPDARARVENTGPEPTTGNAVAETGVRRGLGFGLSSGGGGGGPVQTDVADFCCPDYLDQMMTFIHRYWDNNHGVVGSTKMKFTILRDGTIQAPQVERPSGFLALDNAAMRAVQLTRLPPLPPDFDNSTLTVHVTFEYQR